MSPGINDAVRAAMRPSAADLEPYDPAFLPVSINLSANENGYGMPDDVQAHVEAALAKVVANRYPQPLSDALRAELAAWHGVDPDQVMVGNGGDELLFNLLLAFGGRDHALVNLPPTFSMYRLYAQLLETAVVDVPRDPDSFAVDVDALVTAARAASLVIVTSPNNPTGDLFPIGDTRRLCEACPGIVLLDEAYVEFAPEGSTAAPLLPEFENLAILHTLSKAFCLAGARIGYVLGSPSVVSALATVRQPYSVNALSQAAALEVVRDRMSFSATIEEIEAERERLAGGLRQLAGLGVRVWPSAANFLLVRVPGAHEVHRQLRDERSILVRDFSATPGLDGCLRMTVGTPQENDAVLSALAEILKGGSR